MRKNIMTLLVGLAFAYGLLFVTGYDWFLKGLSVIYLTGHNTAFLDDYKHFDNRKVKSANIAQPWARHRNYNQTKSPSSLEAYHKATKTVAFLVIQNDSVLHEKIL